MLSKGQIQTIENYCYEKGVVYYDLEQEIVDHLASVMEQEQTKFPNKSFKEILDKKALVFSDDWKMIEAEKKKALRIEFFKKFAKEYKSYFTITKTSIILFYILFLVLILTNPSKKIAYDSSFLGKVSFLLLGLLLVSLYTSSYTKIKTTQLRKLLSWKINNRIHNYFIVLFLLFTIITISLKYIAEGNFVYIFWREIYLISFPILLILINSIDITFKKMAKRIHNDYPLAFQN